MKTWILKIIILIAAFTYLLVFTVGYFRSGLRYSEQYAQDFEIQLIDMNAPDRHSYQMYQIIHQSVLNENEGSVPVVIVIHGLASSKEKMLEIGINFALNGFVVYIPDMRGHGSHSGGVSYGISDVQDIISLITWVQESSMQSIINKTSIGLFGHSLGAMVSLLVAAQDARISSTVVYASPANLSYVFNVENRVIVELVGTPVDLEDPIIMQQRLVLNQINMTNPRNVLLGHGQEDEVVSYEQALLINKTLDPYGNRNDFQFISYPHANHELLNASLSGQNITCFQDFLHQSILWHQYHLGSRFDKSSENVLEFNRDTIRKQMINSYSIMVIFLTLSLIPLWVLIYDAFLALIERLMHRDITKVEFPFLSEFEHDDAEIEDYYRHNRKLFQSQFLYIGLFLFSYWVMGSVSRYFMNYSYFLKILILPIIPILPLFLIKGYQERNSLYLKSEGLDVPHAVASLISGAIILAYYNLLYNFMSLKIYATIVIIPFFLIASTGFIMSSTAWPIIIGFFFFGLMVYLFTRQLWISGLSLISGKYSYIEHVLKQGAIKTLSLGFLAATVTSIGIFLFTLSTPNFEVNLIPYRWTFWELIFITGFLIVFGMIALEEVVSRYLTRNIFGAALILAIIYTLTFINSVPQTF